MIKQLFCTILNILVFSILTFLLRGTVHPNMIDFGFYAFGGVSGIAFLAIQELM